MHGEVSITKAGLTARLAEFHSDPRYGGNLRRADMAWALYAAPERRLLFPLRRFDAVRRRSTASAPDTVMLIKFLPSRSWK